MEIKKLAGPGIPGTENEEPLFDIDLNHAEFIRLVTTPHVFLREPELRQKFEELGAPEEIDLQPGSIMITIEYDEMIWDSSKREYIPVSSIGACADTYCCKKRGRSWSVRPH